ncbi:MAG: NADH-quinone oxidoreductase subunit N [Ignavibacteria bacterium]|nr:NADH-quinone oxidoreductase subunit N [Ignavibacteria bacterium]
MIKLQDLLNISPIIILALMAILLLFVGVIFKKSQRFVFTLTLLSVIISIYFLYRNLGKDLFAFGDFIAINVNNSIFAIITLIAVLMSLLASYFYIIKQEINYPEFYPLLLFSAVGMLVMVQANDLITVFIGLEFMSICFYILTGFYRTKIVSNEASLKYFFFGAFMTGFLLLGMALIFGSTGSTKYQVIFSDLSVIKQPIFVLGSILFFAGFFFKIGLFPFHFWVPDVYEGAPTTVTGLMSTSGKIAAVGTIVPFIIRLNVNTYESLISIIALVTMLIGNVLALTQTNMKRLLAYSSIASAGYIFVAVCANTDLALKSIAYYLLAYVLMQLGAFIVVSILEKPSAGSKEYLNVNIEDYKGLIKTNPYLAIMLSIFLLSLSGIPPLAGFWGKYYIFYAAIKENLITISVIAIIFSVISVYYYLKVVVYMWFYEPDSKEVIHIDTFSSIAIFISAILTFIIGIYPEIFFTFFKIILK